MTAVTTTIIKVFMVSIAVTFLNNKNGSNMTALELFL